MFLDGTYCKIKGIANTTFDSDTTITGCTIYIEHVNIENEANVTIDANNELWIDSDFEVELGSELELK